jgi:hypothetical protein
MTTKPVTLRREQSELSKRCVYQIKNSWWCQTLYWYYESTIATNHKIIANVYISRVTRIRQACWFRWLPSGMYHRVVWYTRQLSSYSSAWEPETSPCWFSLQSLSVTKSYRLNSAATVRRTHGLFAWYESWPADQLGGFTLHRHRVLRPVLEATWFWVSRSERPGASNLDVRMALRLHSVELCCSDASRPSSGGHGGELDRKRVSQSL